MIAVIILTTLIAYLLGGIPFALVLGKKLSGGVDVRQHGSGNTGATNVVRVLGLKIGIPVFVCDVLKSTVAVLLAALLVSLCFPANQGLANGLSQSDWKVVATCLAMVAAPLGHCYSPYLHFKGGKAVATSLGGAILVIPLSTLVAIAIFLIVVFITRYVSAASLAAAIAIFFATLIISWGNWILIASSFVLAMLVIVRHRDNIKRLLNGKESKFTVAAKESGADRPR